MKRLRQFFWAFRALLAARVVQDFLRGDMDRRQDWATWIRNLEKRMAKLYAIDYTKAGWRVEVKKRLLQLAAISIAMIEWVDQEGTELRVQHEGTCIYWDDQSAGGCDCILKRPGAYNV